MRRTVVRVGIGVVLCMALTVPAVAGKASVNRIDNFGSVVGVRMEADFPIASLMRADCHFAQLTQRPDGSAVETMECQLSDEPVMIPAFQGAPPKSAFVLDIGPCTWISDYYGNALEVLVWAESAHLVVTPSGRVQATSYYPAQPLSCEE